MTKHDIRPGFVGNTGYEELDSEIDAWLKADRERIGSILVAGGMLDEDTIEHVAAAAQAHGQRIGEALRAQQLITDDQLAEALSTQFDLPLADLRAMTPTAEAVAAVPAELARQHRIVPIKVEDSRVFLVTADPLNLEMIVDLTKQCSRIALMIGTQAQIDGLLSGTYNALHDADTAIRAFELTVEDRPQEATNTLLEVDDNSPIVQVVQRIITQGVRSRASDIHIEAHEHDVRVRFRIDGALSEAIRLPARMGAALSSRVKVLADLNIVERRKPQDGQFSIQIDNRPIDIRTSVVATVHGEKIVMRLLDKAASLINLRDLGFDQKIADTYLSLARAPLGMLLCTGPTGSGKTTTLYATLNEINDAAKNVVTIEDPVEYQFDGVNQMPVGEVGGITFADGLRGILRQDPDIILVGEIRDIETARIATQASLTGHMVLSSLHAIDAPSAVHRFSDMGIEPFLVASALSGVLGQRLLRKTCNACRAPFTPSPDHVRLVVGQADRAPAVWTRGTGCNVCNGTGYKGRLGVYELLVMSEPMRELVIAQASLDEMRELAVEMGMRTMIQEAFDLVAEGVTTVDEVLRTVYGPGGEFTGATAVIALPPGRAAITRGSDAIEETSSEGDAPAPSAQTDSADTNSTTGSGEDPTDDALLEVSA